MTAEMTMRVDELRRAYGKTSQIPVHSLMEVLNIDEQTARNMLVELITKERETAPVVVQNKKPVRRRRVKRKAQPEVKKVTRKPKAKRNLFHELALTILPVLSIIIAIVAIGRSVLFTFNYFNRFNGSWEALSMAVLFSGVIFVMPSVIISSIQNKKWLVTIISSIAFLMFASLNVYIAVSEIDSMRSAKEANTLTVEQQEVIQARSRVADIDSEMEDIDTTLIDKKREWQFLFNQSSVSIDNIDLYNRLRSNLQTTEEEMEVLKNKKETLRSEKKLLTALEGYYTMQVLTEEDMNNSRAMDTLYALSLEYISAGILVIVMFL